MSDFDFDELDKAVNSVIGQPTEESSAGADNASPEDNESASKRNATPSFALHSRTMASNRVSRSETVQETPAPQPNINTPEDAPSVEETPPVSSTPARAAASTEQPYLPKRRSGRFMDVVHPSSDMRSSAKPLTSRREGVSVQPVSQPIAPVIDPSFTSIVDAIESPSSHDSFNNTAESTLETESPLPVENSLGDTLPVNPSLEAAINDLLVSEGHAPVVTATPSAVVESDEETQAPSPAMASATSAAPQIDSPVEPEEVSDIAEENFDELSMDDIFSDNQPQTSPFIEGAKVDKRPLGGLAPAASTAVDEQSESESQDDPSLSRTDIGKDEPLPEELNQDLMSIESLETGGSSDEEVTLAPETPVPETSAPITFAPVEVQKDTAVGDTSTKTPEASTYSGPTSIAQQYKLEPREEKDDETGDIFDTKTYHQPIKDEETKSSPLPWIIGVIIVVLLIAAGLVFTWWSGMLVVPM